MTRWVWVRDYRCFISHQPERIVAWLQQHDSLIIQLLTRIGSDLFPTRRKDQQSQPSLSEALMVFPLYIRGHRLLDLDFRPNFQIDKFNH